MDNNIGKKLDGRYELLELIGVGGMADIYKAHDIVEDRIVAVKILKNELSGSEDFLRRFRNESKAIALLSHSNIVKIFDVGFSEKIQFIVMEYIDGITLTEYIEQQGVLKWRDCVHFTVQILRALQHAHDRGIVHRDIKSQNVMLMPDGTIKVMDFGIARFNRETDKTMSEKAIGSVHYISPEQAKGEITDEKSDIYSVGVMLYEMLTGKKPFDGDNPVSIALMHMQSHPKRPAEVNNSIPEGLEEITLKAMQKEPEKRYQTAGEMINDIEEFKKNPSIVFEYKYFSTDGTTKYFDKVSCSMTERTKKDRRAVPMRRKDNLNSDHGYGELDEVNENHNERYKDYNEPENDYDYDDDVVERRSPLLPILFAVASVFVIMTAWLIYTIVTDNINSMIESGGEEIKMPRLLGMDYDEACTTYPYLNLQPNQAWSSEYIKGQIMEQSVSTGRKIKSSQLIEVTVSKGPNLIELDNYGGGTRHKDDVLTLIRKQGFVPVERFRESDSIPNGFVIETDPAPYELIEEGSTVLVYISIGIAGEQTEVPDFLGLSKVSAEERAAMYKVILIINEDWSDTVEKGRVISQSIDALTKVEKMTTVEVTISKGTPPEKTSFIKDTILSNRTGKFIYEYYIDGVLQGHLTETINIELNKEIYWEFQNTGVHTYAISFTSVETGKSSTFCEYKVDFTGDEVVKTELLRNLNIFKEICDTSDITTTTENTTVVEPNNNAENDNSDDESNTTENIDDNEDINNDVEAEAETPEALNDDEE